MGGLVGLGKRSSPWEQMLSFVFIESCEAAQRNHHVINNMIVKCNNCLVN